MSSNPRQEALDQALAAAHRHRRKGESEAAWRAVDDALALDEHSAAVFEMMGLLYLDSGENEAALNCFEQALAIEPGRRNAEVGLGQATIELTREESRTPEAIVAQNQIKRDFERQASVAAVFSLCIPGLGQMRLLEFGRGAAFLAGEAVLLLLWWALGFGLDAPSHGRRMSMPQPTGLFFVGVVALCVYHGLAAWDAQRLGREIADEEAQWM